MTKNLQTYLENRRVEISTWRGLLEVLISLGLISLNPDQTMNIVLGLMAFSGLTKAALPDRWSWFK